MTNLCHCSVLTAGEDGVLLLRGGPRPAMPELRRRRPHGHRTSLLPPPLPHHRRPCRRLRQCPAGPPHRQPQQQQRQREQQHQCAAGQLQNQRPRRQRPSVGADGCASARSRRRRRGGGCSCRPAAVAVERHLRRRQRRWQWHGRPAVL